MKQAIIHGYKSIDKLLCDIRAEKFLLVTDSAYDYLAIKDYFKNIDIPHIRFSDFTSNPLYEDVVKGVRLFNDQKCDSIIAVGGGSTIDVAKCIKLYCKMDTDKNYLEQEYKETLVPLIAVPTTAGTGSESTRYAVIYFDGKKQSVTHDSIIPDYAVLDHSLLKTLPIYQKKCTLLDALCQAIESWWSVNSTDESKEYSKTAVELIIENINDYIFRNTESSAENIMLAANLAGRAINITQTTAAHAMSYKLTSMYNLPHGHAVALCLPKVWSYMITNMDKCIDKRGTEYLDKVFSDIAQALGTASADKAMELFKALLVKLEIKHPVTDSLDDYEVLAESVNTTRLVNNPVSLSHEALLSMYKSIVQANNL